MEPCLIRVSPTLIHTITMATNILSQYCHQSPITDTDKLADDFTQLPVFAAHIICNNTTTCFSIGQVRPHSKTSIHVHVHVYCAMNWVGL